MKRDWIDQALLVLVAILILGSILALVLWMRHSLPCWVFPLAEAPVRCLPGATS